MALAALQNVWRARSAPEPEPVYDSVQTSMLLPRLLESLPIDKPLCVLDLGPAHPDTVEFFSAYHCRLIFADVIGDTQLLEECTQDLQAWRTQLTRDTEICFDLCLFWDGLNYMDTATARSFNCAIAPLIHKQTWAHGFAVRTPRPQLESLNYGIAGNQEFRVQPSNHSQIPQHGHSSGEVAELMDEFEIQRGTLRRDGRIELLMQAYG